MKDFLIVKVKMSVFVALLQHQELLKYKIYRDLNLYGFIFI